MLILDELMIGIYTHLSKLFRSNSLFANLAMVEYFRRHEPTCVELLLQRLAMSCECTELSVQYQKSNAIHMLSYCHSYLRPYLTSSLKMQRTTDVQVTLISAVKAT